MISYKPRNAEPIHRWYHTVMSFPPELVRSLLHELSCSSRGWLLDPFCGSGTTLVEAKLRGIPSIGIDANPFFALASKVKTTFSLDPSELREEAEKLMSCSSHSGAKPPVKTRRRYWTSVDRGWVRRQDWRDSFSLMEKIDELPMAQTYRDCLKLAVITALRDFCSRVRFGPELYKVKRWPRIAIKTAFKEKIKLFCEDLKAVSNSASQPACMVLQGDARQLSKANFERVDIPIRWVITSPPYPTEHDYTRISRLELELAGFISSLEDLRSIKRRMLRSNSKNIYSDDKDYQLVSKVTSVKRLVNKVKREARKRSYSFAKQYPRVIEEYFGGLLQHLMSLSSVLQKRAMCAYVLGEQCSYFGCFVPTAAIVADLVELGRLPLKVVDIKPWRYRKGTRGTRRPIAEEILLLRRN